MSSKDKNPRKKRNLREQSEKDLEDIFKEKCLKDKVEKFIEETYKHNIPEK